MEQPSVIGATERMNPRLADTMPEIGNHQQTFVKKHLLFKIGD